MKMLNKLDQATLVRSDPRFGKEDWSSTVHNATYCLYITCQLLLFIVIHLGSVDSQRSWSLEGNVPWAISNEVTRSLTT